MNKEAKIAQIVDGSERDLERIAPERPSQEMSLVPSFQERLKRLGGIYYFLVRLLGPVFAHPMNSRRLARVAQQYTEDDVILNVGSGPTRILNRTDIINIDLVQYAEVDILVGSDRLPIKSDVADLAFSTAVLEHVPDPSAALAAIHRCLKPGGKVFAFVPFMQPFHAAPNDYTRWTRSGIRELFSQFTIEDTWIGGGPTSGMLWVVQEWLALVCSLGIRALHTPFLYFFMVLTAPLKLLDLPLMYHPNADKIASGFYVLARKN